MKANDSRTVTVLPGDVLTIDGITTAGSTGTIIRLPDTPGGGEPSSPVAINTSNLIVGPFNSVRRYLISCATGELGYTFDRADPATSGKFLYRMLTADGLVGTLPANAMILYAVVRETSGNAVSISFGTILTGTNVAGSTPIAIPAGGQVQLTALSFDLEWFSATETQALYVNSASWNNAKVTIAIYYVVGP